MRRAPRRDANEAQIVTMLRTIGCTVTALDETGVPDLLVGWRGVNLLLEVKDPDKPPSARKLTRDQRNWHETWNGQADVVETFEDALAVLVRERGRV